MTYTETLEKGFEILIKVLKEDAGDIIFFVTSQNDAINICKKLNDYLMKEKQTKCEITCKGDVYCVEVYAGMAEEKKTRTDYSSSHSHVEDIFLCLNS